MRQRRRAATGAGRGLARLSLPSVGLRARDIAVVVNDADPASVEIGRYYAAKRGIAADRVVHVRFPAGQPVMGFADFMRVQAVLDAKVGADVQAFALAWTLPYRVECMSVTAAFALGFDPAAYCAEGCQTTQPSPYFNSASHAPFTDHRLRPAMLLAGSDVESAKRLIDRGLRSDETLAGGQGLPDEHQRRQPQRPGRDLRAGEGGARLGVSDRAGRRRRARGTNRRDVRVHRRRPGSRRWRATASSTARSPIT